MLDIVFYVAFPCWLLLLICAIGIAIRNEAVQDWYQRMNQKIGDMGRAEIVRGIEPRWERWQELDVDRYNKVLWMFWKSPASFYRGKGYDWMEGE